MHRKNGKSSMTRTGGARETHRRELIQQLQQAARAHSTAVVLYHAAVAAQFGLGPTDIKALELLDRLGPLTPGRLAAEVGLGSSSVTSLLDRLESRGFTRRARDPKDRRQVTVQLDTQRARQVFSHFGNLKASSEDLWASYSDGQLEVIMDFLKRSAMLLTASREGSRG